MAFMKWIKPKKKVAPGYEEIHSCLSNLPPGGRIFRVFEGEQVSPDYVNHPGDCAFVLKCQWRPEDQPIKPPVETIPGYERPWNWRQIQEDEGSRPGRVVIE